MSPYVNNADVDYALLQVFDLLRSEPDLPRRIDLLRNLRHSIRAVIYEEIDHTIVQMRLDGWSNGQIGDALGCSPTAVSQRMKNIRRRRGWDVPKAYRRTHPLDVSESFIPRAVHVKTW